ncbi:MAG: tetratricopeptide repeat protein, partial [Phycisphaerae bacterium]|nr:tetratricopeptide repeat protein [Phycisphaerae bacterium]
VFLYMAIPHLGCLVVLGLVAHLVLHQTRRGDWAFYGAALAATGSWFFVSTGWLTYADSWYLLGLLIVSFLPSRWLLAATCLIEPFIDDRFVLMLPLAFVVRLIALDRIATERWRPALIDLAVIAGLSVPYVLVRLLLLRGTDTASASYLTTRLAELRMDIPWTRYLDGAWIGIRAAWALVFGAIALLIKRKQKIAWIGLVVVVVLSTVIGLTAAADIGRSMSSLFPVALLGLLLVAQDRPEWLKFGLPAILAINLLTPASNVISLFTEPIYYLYTEIDRFENPPPDLNPLAYVQQGEALLNQNHMDDAKPLFEAALTLDPENVPALTDRAALYFRQNDLERATADVDTAARIAPNQPDVLLVRGLILSKQGHRESALAAFQSALDASAANWPNRQACQSFITQLQNAQPTPPKPAQPTAPSTPAIPGLGPSDFHL